MAVTVWAVKISYIICKRIRWFCVFSERNFHYPVQICLNSPMSFNLVNIVKKCLHWEKVSFQLYQKSYTWVTIWNNRYSLILRYIFTLQVPHLVTKGKISQVNSQGLLFLKNQKLATTQVPIEDKVIAEDQLSVGAVHLGLLELQVQEETAQAVGTVVVEQQELLQNTEVADTIRIK